MQLDSLKYKIYDCLNNLIIKEQKEFISLNELYEELARYLEKENNKAWQSQIRGRLQEGCKDYNAFNGEELFITKKVRSGLWKTTKNFHLNQKSEKYIRYKNHTFLVSKDNWKTITKATKIDKDYFEETNSDLIYKAKLIYELGFTKANIIINELEIIRNLLKKEKQIVKIGDGYGTAFEVLAISVLYSIEYEECLNYIIHGDRDGKIDCIYYNNDDTIDIYQIKLNIIDDNAYELMEYNYNMCWQNNNTEYAQDLKKFINEHRDQLKNKKLQFKSISENSKKYTNFKPQQIYDQFFSKKLLPPNNNNIILYINKPLTSDKKHYNVSTDGMGNFTIIINALELIRQLIESLGLNPKYYDPEKLDLSKFFFDNVRGVLKENNKMVCTIINEPHNFLKYNNGLSITGEVIDLTNKICIKNPVINNGQQTIYTLIKHNTNLNKIYINLKITNENNIVTKSNISRFTNEQQKIKAIDMLSLNSYVRDIQKYIYSHEYQGQKYFLEIYTSGRKSYYKILHNLYPKNNIINLLDFMKLYFSLKNKKDLGTWKNFPNMKIETTSIDKPFEYNLSFIVIQAINKYNNFLDNCDNKKEKDDFKSADLAFKYLLCQNNLEINDVAQIIKNINEKYYYSLNNKKSKLIDVYKSTTIIDKLETELALYQKQAVN